MPIKSSNLKANSKESASRSKTSSSRRSAKASPKEVSPVDSSKVVAEGSGEEAPIGRFFVVSAPSGAGKTTLVNRMLEEFPKIKRSISCTTRTPRSGEEDGVDYYFISEKQFQEMVLENLFFEWEQVHGYYYGTPKAPLLKRREKGLPTVLDIDTRGALNLKASYPDSCLIFVMPPSLKILEERLRRRRTEDELVLRRRIENAKREIKEKDKFDYVIMNDSLDHAYQELRTIMREQKMVPGRSKKHVKKI